MRGAIFIGLPASGKSSFFKEQFFRSRVLISLDVLRTRNRERRWLELSLATGQPFVVDNTNPTRVDRRRYLLPAKAAGFEIAGYYFAGSVPECLARNALRAGDARVPDVAIRSCRSRLELPQPSEGFDALWLVQLTDGGFRQEPWKS